MARGKAHPPEVRAWAESLLMSGHSQADVCTTTGLEKTTVSRLAARLGDRLQQVATKKTESDGDLIMGYFRGVLRALTAQTEVFGDPDYCRSQDADKLAIAHGVLGDKLAGIATTAQALGLIGPRSEPVHGLPAADVEAIAGAADHSL